MLRGTACLALRALAAVLPAARLRPPDPALGCAFLHRTRGHKMALQNLTNARSRGRRPLALAPSPCWASTGPSGLGFPPGSAGTAGRGAGSQGQRFVLALGEGQGAQGAGRVTTRRASGSRSSCIRRRAPSAQRPPGQRARLAKPDAGRSARRPLLPAGGAPSRSAGAGARLARRFCRLPHRSSVSMASLAGRARWRGILWELRRRVARPPGAHSSTWESEWPHPPHPPLPRPPRRALLRTAPCWP